MIKAIFFDIDGTLYSHKSNGIPQSTKMALDILRLKGIKTFIATGRHFVEMDALPIELSAYDGMIVLNGQICVDSKREILDETPIDEDDIKEIVRVFENKECPVLLIERDKIYINYVDDIVIEAQKTFSLPTPIIGEYSGGKIYQACVYANEQQERDLLSRLNNCKSTRWHEYGIDLLSKEGGKDVGIGHILQYYGIEVSECMAFGDGENDEDMLRFAGIGVAMGNADDSTKACADYVTDDIDKDGIYRALKHFEVI